MKRIEIRILPELHEVLKEIADNESVPFAVWVRQHLTKTARKYQSKRSS